MIDGYPISISETYDAVSSNPEGKATLNMSPVDGQMIVCGGSCDHRQRLSELGHQLATARADNLFLKTERDTYLHKISDLTNLLDHWAVKSSEWEECRINYEKKIDNLKQEKSISLFTRDSEVSVVSEQLAALMTENRELNEKFSSSRMELIIIKAELENFEECSKKLEDAVNEITSLKFEQTRLLETVAELEASRRSKVSALQIEQKRLLDTARELDSCRAQLDDIKQDSHRLANVVEEMEQSRESLLNRSQNEISTLTEMNQILREKITELEEKVERSNVISEAMRLEAERASSELTVLEKSKEKEIKAHQYEIIELKDENASLQVNIKELEGALLQNVLLMEQDETVTTNPSSPINILKSEIARLKMELVASNDLEESLREANVEISRLTTELTTRIESNSFLQAELEHSVEIEHELVGLKSEAARTRSELLRLSDIENAATLANAENVRLQAELRRFARMQRELEAMKANEIIQKTRLETAFEQKKELDQANVEVIRLQAEVKKLSCVHRELAVVRAENTRIQAMKEEILSTVNELAKSRAEVATLSADLGDARSDITQHKEELERARDRISKSEQEMVSARLAASECETELLSVRSNLSDVQHELRRASEALAKAKGEKAKLSSTNEALTLKVNDKQNKINLLQVQYLELQGKLSSFMAEKEQWVITKQEQEQKITAHEATINAMDDVQSELVETKLELEYKLREAERELETSRSEVIRYRGLEERWRQTELALESCAADASRLAEVVRDKTWELEVSQSATKQLEESSVSLQKELDVSQMAITSLQAALAELQKESERQLTSKIRELEAEWRKAETLLQESLKSKETELKSCVGTINCYKTAEQEWTELKSDLNQKCFEMETQVRSTLRELESSQAEVKRYQVLEERFLEKVTSIASSENAEGSIKMESVYDLLQSKFTNVQNDLEMEREKAAEISRQLEKTSQNWSDVSTELSVCQNKLQKVTEDLESKEADVLALAVKSEQLLNTVQVLQSEKGHLQENMIAIEAACKEAETNHQLALVDADALRQVMIAEQATAAETLHLETEKLRCDAEQAAELHRHLTEALQQEIAGLQVSMRERQVCYEQLESELQTCRSQLAEWEAAHALWEASHTQTQAALAEAQLELDDSRVQIMDLESANTETRASLMETKAALDSAVAKFNALNEAHAALTSDGVTNKLKMYSEEISRMKTELEKVVLERDLYLCESSRLKSEVETLEACVDKLNSTKSELEQTRKVLLTTKTIQNTMQTTLVLQKAELERLHDIENIFNDQRLELEKARAEMATLKGLIARQQAELARLQEFEVQITKRDMAFEGMQLQLDLYKEEIARLLFQLENYPELERAYTVAKAEIEQWIIKEQELYVHIDRMRLEVSNRDELAGELGQANEVITRLQGELKKSVTELVATRAQMYRSTELTRELETYKLQVAKLQDDLEKSAERRWDIEIELGALRTEQSRLQLEASRYSCEREASRTELARMQALVDSLTEESQNDFKIALDLNADSLDMDKLRERLGHISDLD